MSSHRAPFTLPWKRILACAALTIGAFQIPACSSGDDTLPGIGGVRDGGGGATNDGGVMTGPCEDGTERECGVKLSSEGGIVSCFMGTQQCVEGEWGECTDGEVVEVEVPESDGPQTSAQSFGPPSQCTGNPCDPFCQSFEEDPDGGFIAETGGPAYDWPTGDIGDMPPGLVNKGLKEPCRHGEDCQFNHFCDNVQTGSSCGHDKCDTGSALTASCDSCVEDICDADPSCCANTCAHDPCQQGSRLAAACDPCVAAVCAADPYCCNNSWDAACQSQVNTQCGAGTCGCGPGETLWNGHCYRRETANRSWTASRDVCRARGAGWDLVTVNSSTENNFVDGMIGGSNAWIGLNDRSSEGNWQWSGPNSSYRNWGAGEPNNYCPQTCTRICFPWVGCFDICLPCTTGGEDCAEMRASDGRWNDNNCGAGRDSVCEGPLGGSAITPGSWSAACVDAVKTVCDAECDASDDSGQCSEWLPGQTDADCSGIDLAGGVPCGGSVPVCNHGQATAPAGIRIIHFPANSNQYPSTVPDQSHPQMRECFTTEAIPPGECRATPCAGLNGNREIMINPPGSAHVNECHDVDNWTLYSNNISCGPPDCSGSSSEASLADLAMYITLDRSGSMGWNNRWTGSTAALNLFFSDDNSAGIDVALEFFPVSASGSDQGCAWGSCSSAHCANPRVPYGELQVGADPQQTALANAIASVGNPGGGTPTIPALTGALSAARTRGLANPDEIQVAILVTDGNPTQCMSGGTSSTNTALATAARNAFINDGIRTYTISMQGANVAANDNISAQGGGQNFVIGGGNTAQIAADLAAALQSIAAQNVSCDFPLPNAGLFDPNNADVIFTPGSGTAQTLNEQPNAGACGNGWYYDNPSNPTRINLCPNTCAQVQSDPGARISVSLGCPSVLGPTVHTEEYEATCTGAGKVQWGFFAWDTTTPTDTSVVFRARSAATSAGLSSASWVSLGTAAPSPDTQVCALTGPTPCPVDLGGALGTFDAKLPFMELEVTVNPNSSGSVSPDVNDYQVTYSCPPSE